jgi:hypothetical protein
VALPFVAPPLFYHVPKSFLLDTFEGMELVVYRPVVDYPEAIGLGFFWVGLDYP